MFLNRPVLIALNETRDGRALYQLDRNLVFETRLNGDGIRVVVPAEFKTDLASTPRILRPIFPPAGTWSPATILHDYLYGVDGVSRFLADALFREAMAQLGVSWWRQVLAYYCVRLFGKSHYRLTERDKP